MNLGMEIRHVPIIPPMSFAMSGKEMNLTVESIKGGSLNASSIFTSEPAFVEQFAASLKSFGTEALSLQIELRK